MKKKRKSSLSLAIVACIFLTLGFLWITLTSRNRFFDQIHFFIAILGGSFDPAVGPLGGTKVIFSEIYSSLRHVVNVLMQNLFNIQSPNTLLFFKFIIGIILFSLLYFSLLDNRNKKISNREFSRILFLFSIVPFSIAFYKRGIGYWYMATAYPFFLLSLAYIIERLFQKYQVIKIIVVIIFSLFIGRASLDIISQHISVRDPDLVENLTDIMVKNWQQTNRGDLTSLSFMILSYEDSRWGESQFWYFLEKKLNTKLVKIVPEWYNITPLYAKLSPTYIICMKYPKDSQNSDCLLSSIDDYNLSENHFSKVYEIKDKSTQSTSAIYRLSKQ